MVAKALTALASLPMCTGRPADLANRFANPSQELKRLADAGQALRLAHGVYTLVPLTARPGWSPGLNDAAMAWATVTYGDRVPVLMGLGAARFHLAIPRAIAVTVVALPVQHRAMELVGGRVIFVRRDVEAIGARTENGELGGMLVSTIEQTLVDLVARPGLGGMPDEALSAAQRLVQRANLGLARDLAARQRRAAPLNAFLDHR